MQNYIFFLKFESILAFISHYCNFAAENQTKNEETL